jgi:hypothetical protein
MKKLFYTLVLIIIANSCFSQIPNSGFESWTNMGSYENPDSWGTLNNTTALSSVYTATKGSPGSPGSYYLKLTSQTIGPLVANGIAVSGVLDSITQLPKSGFPYSLRPQSFTGKWQHMISGSSQGSISVLLTRWNTVSGARETIANADKTLSGMAMGWASFSIDFTYQSGEFPDTCIIVLKSSGAAPAQGDYLYIDNLAFSGSATGILESVDQNSSIKMFPNPANNEIEFSSPKSFQNGDRLIICDILGNKIFEKHINENSFKINTSGFSNGMYICKIFNRYNVEYSVNKFNVQH